jgi:hypothetical protein
MKALLTIVFFSSLFFLTLSSKASAGCSLKSVASLDLEEIEHHQNLHQKVIAPTLVQKTSKNKIKSLAYTKQNDSTTTDSSKNTDSTTTAASSNDSTADSSSTVASAETTTQTESSPAPTTNEQQVAQTYQASQPADSSTTQPAQTTQPADSSTTQSATTDKSSQTNSLDKLIAGARTAVDEFKDLVGLKNSTLSSDSDFLKLAVAIVATLMIML